MGYKIGKNVLAMHLDDLTTDLAGHTITKVGTVTLGAGKFGNGAVFNDVVGNYLTPTHAAGEFDCKGRAFTAEAWVKGSGPVLATIETISSWVRGWSIIAASSTGYLEFHYGVNPSGTTQGGVGGTRSYSSNTNPMHISVNSDGTTIRLLVDGVTVYSGPFPTMTDNPSANCLMVGASVKQETQWQDVFSGTIDDLRVVRDTCLRKADFTPSTSPFDANDFPDAAMGELRELTGMSAMAFPSRSAQRVSGFTDYRDVEFGGGGRVSGTTKNTPNLLVSRRVRLHEKLSGIVVRETFSDAAGNYAFNMLSTRYSYYAVGFDHTGQYQGVVADNLIPTVM